jgi:hypothetical protein
MRTPHKHAEFIKAWADGCTIQAKGEWSDKWVDLVHPPTWHVDIEYRIKPEKKVMYVRLCRSKNTMDVYPWASNSNDKKSWPVVQGHEFLSEPIAIEYEE